MTTIELSRRARITLRCIQWWHEVGVIQCGRVGHVRQFDKDQALVAAIVAELRKKRMRLQDIRRLNISRPQKSYMVTDGIGTLWCAAEELIACVAACPRPCYVVCVDDLRAKLEEPRAHRAVA